VKGISHTVYATSLFQVLKDHGYFTIHCGKAHFGAYKTPGANPINLGADINIAGSAAGNPASYLGESDYGNVPGKFKLRAIKGLKQYWHSQTFLTRALTLEATKAMDTARLKHKPFFLYMAHYAVHVPYNADPRYFEKYRERGLNKSEAAYAGLIEGMDASLGTLMRYLDTHHLTGNTIIIFMSDNGGLSHPPRTGKIDTQNDPLRNGKVSLYEGGIREPMMVDWPGVTKPGSTTSQYVAIWDFLPTILQMAGISRYHVVQKIDGKSFVPILKDPAYTDTARALVWHYPNNWGGSDGLPGYSWSSAIRKGSWKLIYLQKEGKLKLYNLKNDIGEQHDLAETYPEKTRQLARLLTKKLKGWHAQMPLYKKTGKPVPWPDEAVQ
ncbi:MAG TPA: sulfatase-like hydrolase/transferase, partial [Chitinophagaceae bacterium]|nr:sulfatase-like hydrolase/transferase [Chitinophagaceae bacterium]